MRALLLVAALVAASTARADDPDTAARNLYQEGVALYDHQQFAEARQRFEHAYQLSKRKDLLYNIGVCHRELGEFAPALEVFRRYLVMLGPDAPESDKVRRQIADLERMVPARLEISSRGNPATITIDGIPRGKTPLALDLASGSHVLLSEGAGSPERRELLVSPGERRLLEVGELKKPRRTGLWVGLGVGGVVVAAAVVTVAVLLTRPPELHGGTLDPHVVTIK